MPTTMERFIEAQRADGYSPNTIRARAVCIRSIARQSGVAPEDLRPDHILSYFASHVLRAWSRRTYLNHLSAFGKWLGVNLIVGVGGIHQSGHDRVAVIHQLGRGWSP